MSHTIRRDEIDRSAITEHAARAWSALGAGGFDLPGLAAGVALVPACSRGACNDSTNPAGAGCSAADLCAPEWHVCNSAAELGAAAGACDGTPGFFATRQAQGNDVCAAPPAVNNLVGCGSLGRPADVATCAPLERAMHYDDCAVTSAWRCGSDTDQAQEGAVKLGPQEGGVICCRDAG